MLRKTLQKHDPYEETSCVKITLVNTSSVFTLVWIFLLEVCCYTRSSLYLLFRCKSFWTCIWCFIAQNRIILPIITCFNICYDYTRILRFFGILTSVTNVLGPVIGILSSHNFIVLSIISTKITIFCYGYTRILRSLAILKYVLNVLGCVIGVLTSHN